MMIKVIFELTNEYKDKTELLKIGQEYFGDDFLRQT